MKALVLSSLRSSKLIATKLCHILLCSCKRTQLGLGNYYQDKSLCSWLTLIKCLRPSAENWELLNFDETNNSRTSVKNDSHSNSYILFLWNPWQSLNNNCTGEQNKFKRAQIDSDQADPRGITAYWLSCFVLDFGCYSEERRAHPDSGWTVLLISPLCPISSPLIQRARAITVHNKRSVLHKPELKNTSHGLRG